MNKTQLTNYFDHTFLKPYATEADLTKLCNEAKEIGAAMVAINTTWTRFCKEHAKLPVRIPLQHRQDTGRLVHRPDKRKHPGTEVRKTAG